MKRLLSGVLKRAFIVAVSLAMVVAMSAVALFIPSPVPIAFAQSSQGGYGGYVTVAQILAAINGQAITPSSVSTATQPLFDVTNPAYGAVGDGRHDDTTAIAAAATAANNAKGTLFFPRRPGCVFTGSISSTVLTITAISGCTVGVGMYIQGGGISSTIAVPLIDSLGTGTGQTGTYNLDFAQTVSSTTLVAITSFLTSQPVVLTNADVELDGILRATASMSAVIQGGTASLNYSHHRIFGSGTIDSDDLASRHISLYNYAHVEITGIHLFNTAQVAGIDIGQAGGPGGYEAYIHHMDALIPAGTANVSGAPAFWVDIGTDSEVGPGLVSVGFDTAVKSSTSGNQPIQDIHCWGFGANAGWGNVSNLPSTCFIDVTGAQRWFGLEADTPTVAGFEEDGFYGVIDALQVYNNTTWGLDNTIVGVKYTNANPFGILTNSLFKGATNTHRIAADVTVPSGTLADVYACGNSSPANVVITSISSLCNVPTTQNWGGLLMEPTNTATPGTNYQAAPIISYFSYSDGTNPFKGYCEFYSEPASSASNPNAAYHGFCGGLGGGAVGYFDVGSMGNSSVPNLLGAASTTHLFDTALSAGTGTICPNGTGGEFVNTGCVVASTTNIAGFGSNRILYQSGSGSTTATSAAANSVLVTNGSNVPSLSTTLPAGITLGTLIVTSGRKGTFLCTSGGSILVSNSSYLTTSDVVITMNTPGGTVTYAPNINSRSSGSSFTAGCANLDTSTYNYDILN